MSVGSLPSTREAAPAPKAGGRPAVVAGGRRRRPRRRLSTVRVITGAHDIDSAGAIAAAIGLAMPIGLAGLGGLWSERAGVVNIGLQGMMTLGTWGAGYFGYYHGPWAGILGAILLGVLGGAVHALATVVFGVDHIVSGVAINLLGIGMASYLAGRTFDGLPGGGPTQSPPLQQLPFVSVPGASNALDDVEASHLWLVADLAGILRALTTNLNILSIIAVLLLVASWYVLWRTPFGLRLRSCGEAPEAAETLGVNVVRYKLVAVLISGGMAGLAGGFLVLVASNLYREGQEGGRGFIGLAAMIFGNWRPGGLAGGAALFGYTDAIQLRGGGDVVRAYLLPIAIGLVLWGAWQLWRRRQGKPVTGVVTVVMGVAAFAWFALTSRVPDEFTSMTPYVATLLVLALFSQRLRMPAADGKVYRKGEAGSGRHRLGGPAGRRRRGDGARLRAVQPLLRRGRRSGGRRPRRRGLQRRERGVRRRAVRRVRHGLAAAPHRRRAADRRRVRRRRRRAAHAVRALPAAAVGERRAGLPARHPRGRAADERRAAAGVRGAGPRRGGGARRRTEGAPDAP